MSAAITELSEKDWEVVQMLANGYHYRDISAAVGRTYDGFKNYISDLYAREEVSTAAELVANGFRKGKVG